MATTQNAGDLQLASTSPRMDTLPSTSTIDFANVTGSTKPENNATKNTISYGTLANRPVGTNGDIYYVTDTTPVTEYKKVSGIWIATTTSNTNPFAILAGTVNSANYSSYLSDGSVTARLFSQNVSSPSSTLSTSISMNPGGRDLLIMYGWLTIGATAGSGARATRAVPYVTEAGTQIGLSNVQCIFRNHSFDSGGIGYYYTTATFLKTSTPSSTTTYTLQCTADSLPTGDTGMTVARPTLQITVLKV